MRLLRSTKASVDLTLTQVIGLVLAFLIVLLMIIILRGLTDTFAGTPDEGTTVQYNKLFQSIEILFNPLNQNVSCKLPIGYVEPGYAIVGFNKEGQANVAGRKGFLGNENYGYIEEHCGIDDDIYRPTKCYDKACLCLCYGGGGDITGDDCMGAACRRLPDDVRQLVTTYDGDPVDLVLYGESCWAGVNHDTIAGYTIQKDSSGLVHVRAVFGEQDFAAFTAPNCETILRNLKPVEQESKTKSGPDGPSIDETLDTIEVST